MTSHIGEDQKVYCSIIIPVLNSHEIFRRQILYFENMGLPDNTEIIIIDDGSEPPLEYHGSLPLIIHATNDKRPWTWALARNKGAELADGEYLIMFDIDHIITKDGIDLVRSTKCEKVCFKREFGVLLEDGTLTQDWDVLKAYGLQRNVLGIGPHPNMFAMRKNTFWKLGGYREDLVERPYPQGEDRCFKKAWCEYERNGGTKDTKRGTLYMFPCGKYCGDVNYNPFDLFHNLSRKTKRNYWYQEQLKA